MAKKSKINTLVVGDCVKRRGPFKNFGTILKITGNCCKIDWDEDKVDPKEKDPLLCHYEELELVGAIVQREDGSMAYYKSEFNSL